MSSGPSLSGAKSLSATAPSFSGSQPIAVPSTNFDSSSRRSAGSSSPSLAASTARKGQSSRKQHRNQRRPALNRTFGAAEEDDSMVDFRAVQKASGRRGQTSITHLLDYSAPRPHYRELHHHSRTNRRHPQYPGSGYHTIDKARFVHANYRFVVDPSGNYTSQASDADKHLDWTNVLQIIASAESQTTACPICLSDPVAPRMAHCGHIFCLPCLLRFMNSSSDDDDKPNMRKEARWKKCPICEDSFRLSETKPVRFYHGQESPLPRPGEDVVLRLMVRESGSTLALPKEGTADILNNSDAVPWHFAANVLDYARIMRGTNDYVKEQFEREIEDLRRQAQEDEYQFGIEDGDWTQRAIKAIGTAKDKIKEEPLDIARSAVASAEGEASKGKRAAGQQFHFYTAPPHLYLSPLDIRILKTKFGDFSNFPSTLLPQVEHISTGHVVDDTLRKRAKYLNHLPYGCIVSFLECDWTDIVTPEILEGFSGELERRRKSHRDKTAQEDRERLQAERLEAAAIGRGTRRHFENAHGHHFDEEPTVIKSEDFQPLGTPSGTTPPNPRPGFEHLAEMSTSPSTTRTVWGTTALALSPSLEPTLRQVDDGWLKDDDVFGAAEIALQMEAMGVSTPMTEDGGGGSGVGAAGGGGGGGKKKKKQKQKITLMSTGSKRAG